VRILIIGAGAIGGYLGAHLLRTGHAVTLLVRPKSAEKITAHGLHLREARDFPPARRTLHGFPRAVASLPDALAEGGFDVVLLAMKANGVAAAGRDLLADYPDFPHLITLQNGIGAEEELVALLGADRLTAGSVTTPVRYGDGDRLIVETPRRGVVLAPMQPGGSVSPWLEMLADTGIRTARVDNYRSLKWSKALANIIGNAASAILDWKPARLYHNRQTFRMELGMLREALAVMQALGVPVVNLPGVAARLLKFGVQWLPRPVLRPLLVREVERGRGIKMPSLHIDLSAGRLQSEIHYYNEAIAQAGARAGVATPINQTLAAVLLRLVRGEQAWDDYRHQPQRLIAEMVAAGADRLSVPGMSR
jgi:2-dehydropantoate 2-reductase